jgi:hypothetical protein
MNMIGIAERVELSPENRTMVKLPFTAEPRSYRLCYDVAGVELDPSANGRALARIRINGDKFETTIERDEEGVNITVYRPVFEGRELNAHVLQIDAQLEVFEVNEGQVIKADDIVITNLRLEPI